MLVLLSFSLVHAVRDMPLGEVITKEGATLYQHLPALPAAWHGFMCCHSCDSSCACAGPHITNVFSISTTALPFMHYLSVCGGVA